LKGNSLSAEGRLEAARTQGNRFSSFQGVAAQHEGSSVDVCSSAFRRRRSPETEWITFRYYRLKAELQTRFHSFRSGGA
jgi:hypothetical protein